MRYWTLESTEGRHKIFSRYRDLDDVKQPAVLT